MGIAKFFKNAFCDMKESAKAQHEVDKAEFEAVKAESRANWEELKVMSHPETRKKMQQLERERRIHDANERIAAAKKG